MSERRAAEALRRELIRQVLALRFSSSDLYSTYARMPDRRGAGLHGARRPDRAGAIMMRALRLAVFFRRLRRTRR